MLINIATLCDKCTHTDIQFGNEMYMYKMYGNFIILIYNTVQHSLPQLVSHGLARPWRQTHGVSTIIHTGGCWTSSNVLTMLLLGKWHWLLGWHPAIYHCQWVGSKYTLSTLHVRLLSGCLLFKFHLLQLLLNLCNLIIKHSNNNKILTVDRRHIKTKNYKWIQEAKPRAHKVMKHWRKTQKGNF